ncbi:Uncharacterised protein [Clostridium cochlearium]|uniref:Uncharacterized protein n=1 Tax=Clostridium cochlearium TaxID=1494 RepID=A0A2X2W0V8_CLOCO|nr:Uncharacterised protein [Clostridium cochlearium]
MGQIMPSVYAILLASASNEEIATKGFLEP